MLTLPIKKKWFDMILSGEKEEEYRSASDYYIIKRFANIFHIDERTIRLYINRSYEDYEDFSFENIRTYIKIINGYSSSSPTATLFCKLKIGRGREEWGAVKDEVYLILEILEVNKNET